MEMEENQLYRDWPSIDIVRENNLEEFLEPNRDCCIYRVPQCLCTLSKAAYTPILISIGPLHYGKELMGMESQKKRYRTSFERRVGLQVMEELKTYILDQEPFIRGHYSVKSNLPRSEYAQIILHDAVFIMELFLRKQDNPNDFLLKSPLGSYILADLLLLENQLPYLLLQDLYSRASPNGRYPPFFDLLWKFFEGHNFFKDVQFGTTTIQPFTHFTDFLRCVLVMGAPQEQDPGYGDNDLPCATKLKRSGLKFKGTDKRLLEIEFGKTEKYGKWLPWFEANVLQIPTLHIYDDTEILLRNLMAWEMFHCSTEAHICHYAVLMDYLIDSKEDVDLLVEKKIIVNHVGENAVIASLFNRLCRQIVLCPPSCYCGISRKVIEHYKHPLNHLKTTLKSGYFNNFWTGTATVAAAFLLILTLVQAVCSGIQVYQG